MVFKRRKNIPFKYVRFGSMHHKGHKKSPYLNPNSTIKRLIDIDKLNINLICKSCDHEMQIDVLDLFIELNGKIKINEAIKIMDIKCEKCSNNKYLIC